MTAANAETLGALIARKLAAASMSQSDLARLLAGEGASSKRIASMRRLLIKWIQDDHVPSDENLLRLGEALRLPIEILRDAAATSDVRRPRRVEDRLPTTGDRIASYRVESILSAGAEGATFAATHVSLDRAVALRVLWPHLRRKAIAYRFLANAKFLGRLDHPAILPIYEWGEARGTLFVATKYVARDLSSVLVDGLETSAAVEIICQIASALDALHHAGVVHGDLKPENVLVSSRRAYLADFGTAALHADDAIFSTSRLGYVAPELIRGEALSPSADVYALAAIAFACLVGEPPFSAKSAAPLLFAHLAEPVPRASERQPRLPDTVEAVFARALAKDPEARYVKAAEFADELKNALDPLIRSSSHEPPTPPLGEAGDNAAQPIAEAGVNTARSDGSAVAGRGRGSVQSERAKGSGKKVVPVRLKPHPVTRASVLPLERTAVAACLDLDKRPGDAMFQQAFERSLTALRPAERRGALGGVTGHVAESVAEIVLEGLGWTPVWHFLGPGRHGVDLLLLDPGAERLFAVEVKGTLRQGRWPRLRRGELTQMEVGWLDKSDNPAMSEWGVTSEDVYGAIVLVNFADLVYKVALTSDFATWHPVDRIEQLETLDWLDREKQAEVHGRGATGELRE